MTDDTQVSHEEQETSEEPELELELEDTQDSTEETTAEVSDEAETVESLKAKNAELEAKNRQLYARVKKTPAKKPISNSQPAEDLEWKKKVDFILTKGRDLGAEAIDEVIAYAKGKGISYDQALESPVIKSYLSETTTKQRVAHATPSTSAGSRKIGSKSWSEMNEEERKANFGKLREQQKKK